MNKLPLLILLPLLAVAADPAGAMTAEQKISAVTVYPDRALVTRSGAVKLAPGVQSVVFENLPLGLEEDSVRAKAQGKLKILGVEMRRDYKEAAVNTLTKQMQDEVTKLEDQIQTLTDEQRDLQRRNEFLDQIRNKVTSQSSGADTKEQPASVQNIQGLFQLYGTETSKITTRQREINLTLRDLNKQRGEKANQLALMQQPAAPNTRSAIVTVEAAEPGEATLQVSYLITGAGWQPQYDAYADPETQKVDLTYYGVIRQSTGESWDNVGLTLSSARPSRAARLPELAAWTIDFGGLNQLNQPAMNSSLRISKELAERKNSLALNNSFNRSQTTADEPVQSAAAPEPVADADMQFAEVRSMGPAATFTVPARTTIPSDNQPHRSAISVQGLKGEWTYEATPKLVGGAFLKTRVTNSSAAPLLGGEINAFLGNNYVGKSNIGLVAAGASFDLFLGADENIKVTRTEGLKKEEIGGIISRMKVYQRSFTIEVQNFKTTEASFKLRDQLPVSRNGQITVGVNKVEPSFKTRNADTGEVTWEFKLKPGGKEKITVEYQVNAPYEQVVAGV